MAFKAEDEIVYLRRLIVETLGATDNATLNTKSKDPLYDVEMMNVEVLLNYTESEPFHLMLKDVGGPAEDVYSTLKTLIENGKASPGKSPDGRTIPDHMRSFAVGKEPVRRVQRLLNDLDKAIGKTQGQERNMAKKALSAARG